jgi:hypothetical protein
LLVRVGDRELKQVMAYWTREFGSLEAFFMLEDETGCQSFCVLAELELPKGIRAFVEPFRPAILCLVIHVW